MMGRTRDPIQGRGRGIPGKNWNTLCLSLGLISTSLVQGSFPLPPHIAGALHHSKLRAYLGLPPLGSYKPQLSRSKPRPGSQDLTLVANNNPCTALASPASSREPTRLFRAAKAAQQPFIHRTWPLITMCRPPATTSAQTCPKSN